MTRVELHEDDPGNPDRLDALLSELKGLLLERLATEQCKFSITRNGPEYIQTGKTAPFVRIVVTPSDNVNVIANAIRRRIPKLRAYKIDVVWMPVSIPPEAERGQWYDPSDPLCASRHAKKIAG